MLLKKSSSLVFFDSASGFTGYNFITKDEFDCDDFAIGVIRQIDKWTDRRDVVDSIEHDYGAHAEAMVDRLIELNCLLKMDSEQARREAEFQKSWEWKVPSAMLHFAVTGRDHLSVAEVEKLQQERKKREGTIGLTRLNNEDCSITLEKPDLEQGPFVTMKARRTERECGATTVSLKHLSDCLFAGLGITGWTSNSVNKLPLKMTPSGGARNPYEAYVMACNVEGLKKGFYHYSAEQHSLLRLNDDHKIQTTPAQLLGGQEWANDAAAVIFLCADFRRTMWKYESDDNAYRVVLIEAGHIAQNIMLAATYNGYSACPSAALSHEPLHKHLGLKRITDSALYALVLNRLPQNN